MTRRNQELLARLVAGTFAHGDWARRFDEEGFDSYRPSQAQGTNESIVVFHSAAGLTVRLWDFEAGGARPDAYPDGWPHVAHEGATLVESTGEGVDGRTMAWVDPRDPDALWAELRRVFAEMGWCEGPPAPAPPGQEWAVARAAIALWRHPQHDLFRTLAWYDVAVPEPMVFIGLSEPRLYRGRPADTPEPGGA